MSNDATAASRVAQHTDTLQRHDKLGTSGTLAQRLAFIGQLQSQACNFTPDAIVDLIFPNQESPPKVAIVSHKQKHQLIDMGSPAPQD
jgi:hypothetical protein